MNEDEKYIIYTNDTDLQTAALAILLNSKQIAETNKNAKFMANIRGDIVGIEVFLNEQSKRIDVSYLITVQEALQLDEE